jgi:hypothetical protein
MNLINHSHNINSTYVVMASFLRAIGVLNPTLLYQVKPVAVLDIENAVEKRPRTLKHLIKANHANFKLVLDDNKLNRLSYVGHFWNVEFNKS